MTTYQIYRIREISAPNNSHKCDRHEELNVQFVTEFSDEQEARTFVRDKNRAHSEMVNHIPFHKSESDQLAYIDRFCFDDSKTSFLTKRKFFLGYPDIDAIKNAYRSDGVRVLKNR